jgi:hypothetical protein
MDSLKKQHERAIAEAFIDWYNKQNNTKFSFHKHGEPPDFVYIFENQTMLLEVTAEYYDEENAKMLWQNARRIPNAPQIWIGKEPDQSLISHANIGLTKKCAKKYPDGCILLINIYPDITTSEEFELLINQINIPSNNSFIEIYVGGNFPVGGFHYWKLF